MPAEIKSASESCSESSEVEKDEIIKEKTVNPRRQEPESECSVSADGQHWNVESETEPSVVWISKVSSDSVGPLVTFSPSLSLFPFLSLSSFGHCLLIPWSRPLSLSLSLKAIHDQKRWPPQAKVVCGQQPAALTYWTVLTDHRCTVDSRSFPLLSFLCSLSLSSPFLSPPFIISTIVRADSHHFCCSTVALSHLFLSCSLFGITLPAFSLSIIAAVHCFHEGASSSSSTRAERAAASVGTDAWTRQVKPLVAVAAAVVVWPNNDANRRVSLWVAAAAAAAPLLSLSPFTGKETNRHYPPT